MEGEMLALGETEGLRLTLMLGEMLGLLETEMLGEIDGENDPAAV